MSSLPSFIILDTGPLSNCVVQVSRGSGTTAGTTESSPTVSEQCRQWLTECERSGAVILVPAIAYYEALRELERRKAAAQRLRLQTYCFQPDRFIPLTTAHLELAATLWAQARNSGSQTAGDGALDGDGILCAQVQSLGLSSTDYVVATTNTRHLKQFVNADQWQNIKS